MSNYIITLINEAKATMADLRVALGVVPGLANTYRAHVRALEHQADAQARLASLLSGAQDPTGAFRHQILSNHRGW